MTCRHCYGIGYDSSGYPCACQSPAKVAKVGRKIHGKEPLRGSAWRRQLKHLAQALLLVLAVIFVSGLGVFLMRLG